MSVITIPRRFNGPPDSANGGYTCGLFASAVGQPVRIRLKRPVPLETPLQVVQTGVSEWQLLDNEEVIATATPADVRAEAPAPPTFDAAVAASRRYPRPEDHDLPGCFVCGPARRPGDGLRVFAAAVEQRDIVAAPWEPDASLADNGQVRPEYIWAALDCPGAFTAKTDKYMLLGELAVRIDRRPRVNERCVVMGWSIGNEGRKHFAGTAVVGADRALCALGVATWIELKA